MVLSYIHSFHGAASLFADASPAQNNRH